MKLLGIDIGSSSVKAAVLHNGQPRGRIVRTFFKTVHQGARAEVPGVAVLKAMADAIVEVGDAARRVDAIGLSVMCPAWCAMDARGNALTPLVTHQDRRSVDVARDLEKRIGKSRHLRLAGNRPFPGGISSTTWAWYQKHEPERLARAELVGQLNTYVHRHLTGARVIDPSNASFTGLFSTVTQTGWNDELCDAIRAKRSLLPEILEADVVAGHVNRPGARRFNLTQGTPVMTGMIDTSAAMLLGGAKPGQLLNVCGSTDVLALCTDTPRPHERLLTRALGVGQDRWMCVSTLAAAGATLLWAKQQFFSEMQAASFRKLVRRLARQKPSSGVSFEPYLAGERTSIEQRQAAFGGLTLSTTREQMLHAAIDSLARASADRLSLFDSQRVRIRSSVIVSGGASDRLDEIFHRDWPRHWRLQRETEASLRGLGKLTPRRR